MKNILQYVDLATGSRIGLGSYISSEIRKKHSGDINFAGVEDKRVYLLLHIT